MCCQIVYSDILREMTEVHATVGVGGGGGGGGGVGGGVGGGGGGVWGGGGVEYRWREDGD